MGIGMPKTWGCPYHCDTGHPGFQKFFFGPFGPQFGLKIKKGVGQAPQARPLDLPLLTGDCINRVFL